MMIKEKKKYIKEKKNQKKCIKKEYDDEARTRRKGEKRLGNKETSRKSRTMYETRKSSLPTSSTLLETTNSNVLPASNFSVLEAIPHSTRYFFKVYLSLSPETLCCKHQRLRNMAVERFGLRLPGRDR